MNTDKKEITLPVDSDIVIISAAVTNSECAEIKTPLLEEVEERKFNFKKKPGADIFCSKLNITCTT